MISACGSSGSSATHTAATSTTPPAPTSTVTQAADPKGRLRFVKPVLHARAGEVKVAFTNASPVPHNLTIERGTRGPPVGATQIFRGGERSLTVDLKPGRYTFYCDVPGHRQAGMHGTLIVR